jgi:hypothetical protein
LRSAARSPPARTTGAVALLVSRSARPQPATLEIDAKLAGIGSPPPTDSDMSDYDRLRDRGARR